MIEVSNLTKRYGGQAAVQDVSFRCEPGTVTGFLGPNGAGKSTTMRMLCGLATPTSGTARIAERPYAELPNPGRHVGVLLDASAQHGGRTGREALALVAATTGVPEKRATELLALVGLDGRAAGRRVGQYSLGMRQRLGIALALVGDPSVLVLDEPANGLDPEGIQWMRRILREFADRGGTVLLSSHLLHEVEAVADRLVMIAGGRIVASGAKEELLAGSGVRVRAVDRERLHHALADADIAARDAGSGDDALVADADPEAVGRAAAAGGVVLTELRPADGTGLEALFFSLTAEPGGAPAPGDPSGTPALAGATR